MAEEVGAGAADISRHDVDEARDFLRWLAAERFVFLGHREYVLVHAGGETRLEAVRGSGLGVLRSEPRSASRLLSERARALALEHTPLLLSRANARATVHRPTHLDYVGVRRFGADGVPVGEHRFLGLYTTAAHRDSTLAIPLVREKIRYVLSRAGFPPDSHDAKALRAICEEYPRDSLFQIEPEELERSATGMLALGERQRVRLFARQDALGRFVNCLVCLPRDRVTTQAIDQITEILVEAFDGSLLGWDLQRTESTVARARCAIRTRNGVPEYEEADLERRIADVIRSWTDDLREALLAAHGAQTGLAEFRRYESAFPPAYRDDLPAAAAVSDIGVVERLRDEPGPILRLYRAPGASPGGARCRLFSREPMSLSDVLPKFERMGTPVGDERPYEVRPLDGAPVWVYDFGLVREVEDLEAVHELFEEAFLGVWRGEFENDSLGALVLGAEALWRADCDPACDHPLSTAGVGRVLRALHGSGSRPEPGHRHLARGSLPLAV